MKVKDLKENLGLPAETQVLEIKPGSKYLLHIKSALPENVLEQMRWAFEKHTNIKVTVLALPADIALYEIATEEV